VLDYAWIIPALPAVSFLLILFFGKKMPLRGAEIGIGGVGASFLLSVVAVFQWIDRVDSATGHSNGLAALGRGLFAGPAHEAEPVVQPSCTRSRGGRTD
jgi:NADH-quinone oxidoreductase subunit L